MENSINLKRRTFLRGTLATGAVIAAASAGLLRAGQVLAAEWPAAAFQATKLDEAMKAALGSTE
ncbi:MAG: thiosulfate oxidation carrier protein SoxY, partial [Pseudomonadota bacterium]